MVDEEREELESRTALSEPLYMRVVMMDGHDDIHTFRL